ncbi:MAG: bifunctional [glutamate--ammonia ligase]-adenylyl-L-tyrosine phosphorylase/[glutamate--ammonia-ligase] adenylyltransferase [Gammaproteobacteria bacterium]|nr:bifunctional [glutamate--ammonia ligase]-adenylyl-L-tyrosine phosphorylase/[glutamate--ammonia-ligase] adenylyltransferase [Gammaproteobacteria bacterium]
MVPQLASLGDQHLTRFSEALHGAGLPPLTDELARQARLVFSCSDYAARTCQRWPQLWHELSDSGRLHQTLGDAALAQGLDGLLADAAPTEEAMMAILRRFRHVESLRIAWRDLCGLAELPETLHDLSALADACIDASLDRLYEWHCDRWGTPRDVAGEQQRLIVLGLGKLGGRELNFSSDVDLIFAFKGHGETDAAAPRANIEFFTRLGQRLIRVLSEPTVDGFAYRVDMRLRPFGDSGPLVASGEALEHYYLTQGRDWERYAMIKARVVAGDRRGGEELLSELQPFVYRRYLDYGAFSALRSMKDSIRREQHKRGMVRDVKLSDGGIREIEFIGQAFQLIRGGREPQLRVREIDLALQRLAIGGHLPEPAVGELRAAYEFLRRLENRLQMLNEEQTHALPDDELARQRIAYAMSMRNWPELSHEYTAHTGRVAKQFMAIFANPQDSTAGSGDRSPWLGLWQSDLDDPGTAQRLQELGYNDAPAVCERLSALRNSFSYKSLSQTARERFDKLMPSVLRACAATGNPDETLYRTVALQQQIAGRSTYLVLLHEHPQALNQLVKLFSASPWVAQFVSQHPILLDELLDPRSLYQLPDRAALSRDLADLTGQLDPDDQEAYLDRIRQFKNTNVLRVAAVDITGEIDVGAVSKRLTCLAEVILENVYATVREQLEQRHGRPTCRMDGGLHYPQLAIIAYGKLGGVELGYGSDLDLVFLHDSQGEKQSTDGGQPVDNGTFFARVGQRLIHFLATRTAAGVLYEIDTRLRPNGNSGLLVSSLDAFEKYQREDAWTWEHQALVRARPVVASQQLGQRFAAVREGVLLQDRDVEQLRGDIVQMRRRMRVEQSEESPEAFLKRAAGGITDIEFMVQYKVLAAASDYPRLLAYTDNQRLLEELRVLGLLAEEDARVLAEAYPQLRAQAHRAALGEQPDAQTMQRISRMQDSVMDVWQRTLEVNL